MGHMEGVKWASGAISNADARNDRQTYSTHMTSLLQLRAVEAGQSTGNFLAAISRLTWTVMHSLQVVCPQPSRISCADSALSWHPLAHIMSSRGSSARHVVHCVWRRSTGALPLT